MKNNSDNLNICEYCNNEFASKTNLTNHQRKAIYCLKLQGSDSVVDYICSSGCNKKFSTKQNLNIHNKICKSIDISKKYKDLITELKNKIIINDSESKNKDEQILSLKQQLIDSKNDNKHLQDKLAGIAEKAASRPTTTNSTTNNRAIFINQRLEKLDRLDFDKIKDNIDSFTIEYHRQGAEGYGKHALKEVFKNKLVCTDQSRNKFKFKDKHGNIVEDVGLVKCMEAYVDAYKMKAYEIAQDHYQELAKQFSEKEMDTCPTMEWVIAFAQFKYHNDTAFCRDIVDYMKKNCNDEDRSMSLVEV
jgi:hypothetical protein